MIQRDETAENKKNTRDVEDVINKALKKLGAKKEAELCRYLPMGSDGYMHHFTFRKLKQRQPQELIALIETCVLQADKPQVLQPKQRAARGSRKRRDQLILSKTLLERMLSIARMAGDKEMVNLLSPKKSLSTCKRELITSIRQGKADHELWNTYLEALASAQSAATDAHFLAQSK